MEGDFPKLVGGQPNPANLALWCRHGDIIHLKSAGNSSVLQVSGVNSDLEVEGGFLECICVFNDYLSSIKRVYKTSYKAS